jgi:ADP-heptose:LPS heptosyltransferase
MVAQRMFLFLELFFSVITGRFKRFKSGNRIVLIKLDAIGDFFIMLSALNMFKRWVEEIGENLVVVCSSELTDLGGVLFPTIEWVGVNKNQFKNKYEYRNEIIKQLNKKQFEVAINLVGSRDWISDYIVARVNAKKKVGYVGDCAKQNSVFRWVGLVSYDQVVTEKKSSEFLIVLSLLKEGLGQEIIAEETTETFEKNNGYVVIFPGSSWFGKSWDINRFKEIALKLIREEEKIIILCGGPDDERLSQVFEDHLGPAMKNLIGKTSLVELCDIIKNADGILTNDTSAAHIAEYYHTRGVAVVGGGHYGRFLPYGSIDQRRESVIVISKEMDCFGCNWKCIYDHGNKAVPCVEEIEEKVVYNKLVEILR